MGWVRPTFGRARGVAVTIFKNVSVTGKAVAPVALMAAVLVLALGFAAAQIGEVSAADQAVLARPDPAAAQRAALDGRIGAALSQDLAARCATAGRAGCRAAERETALLIAGVDQARLQDAARRAATEAAARQTQARAQATAWGVLAVGVLAALLGAGLCAWIAIGTLARPLVRLTVQLNALALGRSDVRVTDRYRSDEIGAMARAAAVFRETIAARRRAEAQAAAARADAESARRGAQADLARVGRALSVGEFASSIAHEINQPISAIVMNCDACENWLSEDEELNLAEARATVQRIARDAKRAGEVVARIRRMLTNAKPDCDAVDLNDLLDEALSFTEAELRRWGVVVRRELAPNLPAVVGDKVQLQQVMVNLISNAIDAMKATPEGQRALTVASGLTDDRQALVTVRDRGPGFAPGALDKLFTPFFTTKATGIGLGLSISRSIVETHGGRLWASALEPQGASFNFTVRTAQDNVLRPAGFAVPAPAARPAVRVRVRRPASIAVSESRPRRAVARAS